MRRKMLVVWLGLTLCAGCGTAASDGDAPTDVTSDANPDGPGSGDVTDDCGGCPPGESCVAGACESDEPDEYLHYDCGGGIYCENGQIWIVPVGDDPDAEDPCAPSLQETCEYGCDESAALDRYDDSTWCSPAPCTPEAQGIEGTPVDFELLGFECEFGEGDSQEGLTLETEVVIATSAEQVLEQLALIVTCVDAPAVNVDFETHRVAVLKGMMEQDAPSVHWVVESGGTIWVDLRVPPAAGGALPPVVPYVLFVVLPAGDTPVEGNFCAIPRDGRAMP